MNVTHHEIIFEAYNTNNIVNRSSRSHTMSSQYEYMRNYRASSKPSYLKEHELFYSIIVLFVALTLIITGIVLRINQSLVDIGGYIAAAGGGLLLILILYYVMPWSKFSNKRTKDGSTHEYSQNV